MKSLELSIGFSTCPNDTFIFDALINNKIPHPGLSFKTTMADVEELNNMAMAQTLDITKLSFFAYAEAAQHYQILDSGSALGYKNGPLVITNKPISLNDISKLRIAIPGAHTTANFLFSYLFPDAKNKKEYLFSDIERAIQNNEVDAGVIIHETRFTYQQHGFTKLADLGKLWEKKTKLPIPLGCIAIKRRLPQEVKVACNALIRNSIAFAFSNRDSSLSYCKQYAQEMSETVMKKHIDLYVNDFSASLGSKGKLAIAKLYKEASLMGLIDEFSQNIFAID